MIRVPSHSIHPLLRLATLIGLAVASLFVLAACEEDVTAVTGVDQPYTLYGTLTPQADTQSVFLFDIEGTLTPTPPVPIDAVVTSRNLDTGEEWTWRDSLVQNDIDLYAHALWAPFPAAFGDTYRIEATRSDGASSSVEVTVPPATSLILPPRQETTPSSLDILVEGDAPNLIQIRVTYRYRYETLGGLQTEESTLPYDGRERRSANGWVIPLNIAADVRALASQLKERVNFNETVGLTVIRVEIRLIVANEEWKAPGGTFDPEVLVQPGLLDNVDNGFGFVGAGYRHRGVWVPRDTLGVE